MYSDPYCRLWAPLQHQIAEYLHDLDRPVEVRDYDGEIESMLLATSGGA